MKPLPLSRMSRHTGWTSNDRAEVMLAYLRACESAEGQHGALASILASATFLRERRGENYTVGVLHQVEAITSRAAALDRWQPGQGAVQ